MIEIFTDGSAKGNPGPGGYGVVLKYKGHRKELSEGFRKTTNNRMELLAVITALELLKSTEPEVHVYSDSKYVTDAVNQGWLENWVRKDFKKVKNPDLWKRFLEAYKKYKIKFIWIKGHAGHPENERCDELAVAAAENKPDTIDKAYEEESKKQTGY